MNETQILTRFSSYLKLNNYAKGTIKNYCKDLEIFFNFLKEYWNIGLKIENFNIFILLKIKQSDIIAFLVYLNTKMNNNSATRQRKLASIKKLYKWICLLYPQFNNPIKDYWIENTERLPKYLNLEQAKQIENVFNKENHRHYKRDNLIIKVFLITGIRLNELLNIKIENINFDKKIICVKTKGNKEKNVYISNSLEIELKNFIYNRNKNEYLFKNYKNQKLSSTNIQHIIKKAYNLLGIEDKGYSVHTLRHTAATIMYETTKDILVVKEFLGHSTVLSTQIYSHVSNDLIKDAVNKNPLNII